MDLKNEKEKAKPLALQLYRGFGDTAGAESVAERAKTGSQSGLERLRQPSLHAHTGPLCCAPRPLGLHPQAAPILQEPARSPPSASSAQLSPLLSAHARFLAALPSPRRLTTPLTRAPYRHLGGPRVSVQMSRIGLERCASGLAARAR